MTDTQALLQRYAALIRAAQTQQNLLSANDLDRLEARHIADCLELLKIAGFPTNGRIVDIGSGAGLPGIVLAIACPTLHITCVESEKRKCEFLNAVIADLNLKNAVVLSERAEILAHQPQHRAQYDTVTSRACAAWPLALELAAALVKTEKPIFLFGSPAQQAALQPSNVISELGLENQDIYQYVLDDPSVHFVIGNFTAQKKLADKYPRAWKAMLKKPL